MGRKKLVKNENDQNEKKQMMAYNKATRSVLKKAYELSTLCTVKVCAIIFGPNSQKPDVWPEDPTALNSILTTYLNTPAEKARKRALNPSTLPKISENDQVLETGNDNQVDNLSKCDLSCDDWINSRSSSELVGFVNHLDSKLELIMAKIEAMNNSSQGSLKLEDGQYYFGEEQTMSNIQVMPNIESQYPNVVDDCLWHIMEEQQQINMTNQGGLYNFNNNINNVGNDIFDGGLYNFNDNNNFGNNLPHTLDFTSLLKDDNMMNHGGFNNFNNNNNNYNIGDNPCYMMNQGGFNNFNNNNNNIGNNPCNMLNFPSYNNGFMGRNMVNELAMWDTGQMTSQEQGQYQVQAQQYNGARLTPFA